jgi:hypothetical protein
MNLRVTTDTQAKSASWWTTKVREGRPANARKTEKPLRNYNPGMRQVREFDELKEMRSGGGLWKNTHSNLWKQFGEWGRLMDDGWLMNEAG